MLLQSHRGFIEIFPAIPAEWKEVSFRSLRAQGAVLVTASMKNGMVTEVILVTEKGGEIKLKSPFKESGFRSTVPYENKSGVCVFIADPGQKIILTADAR